MKMKIPQVFLALPWMKLYARSSDRSGTYLAFAALILYGTYNAFAKGLTEYLSPISLLILSEALTAVFVVITIGLLPLLRLLFRASGRQVLIAICIGILSSGIAPLLWFKGLSDTTAINSSILTGSAIIFSLAFDWLLLREKINALQMIGATVVFFGIVIIATGPNQNVNAHIGDLYIIAKGVFFALGTALFKKNLTKFHPEAALFLRSVTGIIFALTVGSFISHPFAAEITSFPLEKITLLFSFAFFSRFLQLTFFYAALDRTSANKVALINHATPLAGVFFAVMLLGEKLYQYHLIGACLIIAGLIVEHISTERVGRAFTRITRYRMHQHQQS